MEHTCYICLSGETLLLSPLQQPCCSLRFHPQCLATWCRMNKRALKGTNHLYMPCDACSTPIYVTSRWDFVLQRRTVFLYEVFPYVYLVGLCVSFFGVSFSALSMFATRSVLQGWGGEPSSSLDAAVLWDGTHWVEGMLVLTCCVLTTLCSCLWVSLCVLHRSTPPLSFSPSRSPVSVSVGDRCGLSDPLSMDKQT